MVCVVCGEDSAQQIKRPKHSPPIHLRKARKVSDSSSALLSQRSQLGHALLLLLLVLVLHVHDSLGDLDYSRLHIVDTYVPVNHQPTNLLVRSNMPVNSTGFDLDGLVTGITQRATALHLALEYPLYLRVVSLNNDFDKRFELEKKFWKDRVNAQFGHFTNWPLGLAGIETPASLSPTKRWELLNTTVWAVDKLPTRITELRQMLVQPADPPTPAGRSSVTIVHCTYSVQKPLVYNYFSLSLSHTLISYGAGTAGCDRTGEVIGAYRTLYGGLGADGKRDGDFGMKPTYALDTSECGRSPNYWSTTALEWWCFELQYNRRLERGNCTDFAVCQPLKHGQPCEPTNRSQWALGSGLDSSQ
eukprot:COSAG02_NODE_896_length_16125_cov_5.083489_7_plen_359_part_00